jgi:dihydroneopterin aldolase
MDKVRVAGLALSALIGVDAWERHVRQTVRIDIEFDVDASTAAATDDLADAVDYGAVARRITDLVENSGFRLIETLAERIAECVLAEFRVPRVKVVLHKPNAVPNAHDTSLEIERHRR